MFTSILPKRVYFERVVSEQNPVAAFCRYLKTHANLVPVFNIVIWKEVAMKVGLDGYYDCAFNTENQMCRVTIAEGGLMIRKRSANSCQFSFRWPELIPCPTLTTRGKVSELTYLKDGLQFKLAFQTT